MGIVVVARLAATGRRCPVGHEEVDLETNQLGGQVREPTVLFIGPAELNDDVLALYVTEVAKLQSKCLYPARPAGREVGAQEPDPRDVSRLLGLGCDRPGEEAASNSRDEGPAIHYSIT